MRAVCIVASGSNITTGAASASAAIPNTSANTEPQFIRVAATAAAYVKVGASGVTAAAGDILVLPEAPIVLRTHGNSHIAAIQASAAGVVNVCPLEDSHL